MTLPTHRAFVTALISSIPAPDANSSDLSNRLKASSIATGPGRDQQSAKALLLTLHVLFPNELLPALDLLDRGLVTRLKPIQSPSTTTGNGTGSTSLPKDLPSNAVAAAEQSDDKASTHQSKTSSATIYQVRSAQPPPSRYRHASHDATATSTHYEVRPTSWTCSCPAFAFAAFPAGATASRTSAQAQASALWSTPPGSEQRGNDDGGGGEFGGHDWLVGGLSAGDETPVCKHLLACVLGERCEMFALAVLEREVGGEEMGGWAAGWGA